MLDHLDDPQPFVPGEEFRQQVLRRGGRLRWRHRVARGSVGALAVVGLLGTGLLYVERRDAAIDRVEVTTQPSVDGAVNVLLVGVDEPNGRSDTLVVVRFDEAGSVRMLSVPRDLWDPDDGNRINQLHATGGLQALLDSIDRTTGIPIDHVVRLDVDGLRGLVDAVGGLRLAIDLPIRNEPTGLDLPPSACATLDGDTALALIRARHLEVGDGAGGWVADPTGDLGRMARAHAIATAALTSLAEAGSGPADLDRYSRLLADHAVLDSGLTLDRLVDLGRRLAAAGPTGLESDSMPVEQTVSASGAAVLIPVPGAEAIFELYGAAPAGAGVTAPSGSVDAVPAAGVLHPC